MSKKMKIGATNADRISDLPEGITELILRYLPIRDAVKTSILSKKWRYKWTNLEKLVFNKDILSTISRYQHDNITRGILHVICKILLQKRGPILEFDLDITTFPDRPDRDGLEDLDLLAAHLSRNNLERLTLNISKSSYKLPTSLFSCLTLTHLDLKGLSFLPPRAIMGFTCLTSLKLDGVSFNNETFSGFISNCLVLETLSLIQCSCFSFEVRAPRLKWFLFEGNIEAIRFKNTPLLSTVQLYPETFLKMPKKEKRSELVTFFRGLPALGSFDMNYNLFKSMVVDDDSIPEKLPTDLVNLINLELYDISFGTMEEALFILCLINSCPNLKNLTIQVDSEDDDEDVEDAISEKYSILSLQRLKEFVIGCVSGTSTELTFIRLLLGGCPVLESLTVEPRSNDAGDIVSIYKSIVEFKRLSPDVEIIFQ